MALASAAVTPELLGWIASITYVLRLLPQPVRLWRTGLPAGVSTVAAWNALLCDLGWAAYGASADLPPVLWVSVVAAVPGVWTVVLLRRETRARDLAIVGALAAVFVLAGVAGVLGVVLGLSVVITTGPQVLVALRQSDLRGIAPATWLVSIADAALWGAYGLAVGDGALLGYAAVLSTAAVIVLGRIAWTRRFVVGDDPDLAPATATV